MSDISDHSSLKYAVDALQASMKDYQGENIHHQFRVQLDPFVYKILESKYLSTFQTYWNQATIPLQSEKAIVIVERRCHPNLDFCLKNAVYFARGYSLYIFCSQANKAFVESICGNQAQNIHIIPIFEGIGSSKQGRNEYNSLLKQLHFWSFIDAKVCLTIETDCYLRNFIPDSIYQYDYVASKWPWLANEPGGGGLSMRNLGMMHRICTENETTTHEMQDTFVSQFVQEYSYTFPTIETNYFVEALHVNDPVGVHQWWTFLVNMEPIRRNMIIDQYLTLHVQGT